MKRDCFKLGEWPLSGTLEFFSAISKMLLVKENKEVIFLHTLVMEVLTFNCMLNVEPVNDVWGQFLS